MGRMDLRVELEHAIRAHGVRGYVTSGHGISGYVMSGHGISGYVISGHGIRGYVKSGHGINGQRHHPVDASGIVLREGL